MATTTPKTITQKIAGEKRGITAEGYPVGKHCTVVEYPQAGNWQVIHRETGRLIVTGNDDGNKYVHQWYDDFPTKAAAMLYATEIDPLLRATGISKLLVPAASALAREHYAHAGKPLPGRKNWGEGK